MTILQRNTGQFQQSHSPASGLLNGYGMVPGGQTVSTPDQRPLIVEYDPAGDTLYVSLDPITPAANVEVEEGIYVRVDPETHQVVGIQVLDCSARLRKDSAELGTQEVARALLERYGPTAQARYAARISPSFAGTP